MKAIYKLIEINTFVAIKKQYNSCVDKNDFYSMLKRRLKTQSPKRIAQFLISELHIHFKECSQYQ